MTECPINKRDCPCQEYSKEGLCDYPYRMGASWTEIRNIRSCKLSKEGGVMNTGLSNKIAASGFFLVGLVGIGATILVLVDSVRTVLNAGQSDGFIYALFLAIISFLCIGFGIVLLKEGE